MEYKGVGFAKPALRCACIPLLLTDLQVHLHTSTPIHELPMLSNTNMHIFLTTCSIEDTNFAVTVSGGAAACSLSVLCSKMLSADAVHRDLACATQCSS